MTLSILLPTRNGAAYLPACIRAVLSQEADDFELVVSDNANEDGTAEVLAEHASDPRLRVVRTDEVIPVTDNWRRALEASSGDHVLMLGDDDLLLPGAVARIQSLLGGPDRPQCVTYNAFSYVFPSSMSGISGSRYAPRHFHFGDDLVSGRLLTAEQRRGLVLDMFRFRPRIPLNMQTTVFSRALADSIPGGAFQPPFPDHFALNAMLLRADRWLFTDERLLVVGVSPKSFGHFVYSSEQGAGLSYLGIDVAFDRWLPGNQLLSAMHVWLDLLRTAFPQELAGVEISRGDYAARQLWWLLQGFRSGALSRRALLDALRAFSFGDLVAASRRAVEPTLLRQAVRRTWAGRRDEVQLVWEGLQPLDDVHGIEEFAAFVRPVGAEGS